MPLQQPKLNESQRAEVAERYGKGETAAALAKEFDVSPATMAKYVAGTKKPLTLKALPQSSSMARFKKEARSLIWRRGDKGKTYKEWEAKIAELEKGGIPHWQAVFQASKDFLCLEGLFSKHDVSEFDPRPGSHPHVETYSQSPQPGNIQCENKEKTHRENLQWAIDAAGRHKATKEVLTVCPNWSAYYLYQEAVNEPQKFLTTFNQIEGKCVNDPDEDRIAAKSGKGAIKELNQMLETLEEESENEN